MIKTLIADLENLRRALNATFGPSPIKSSIWLALLTMRALSMPLLIWLTGYIINLITDVESLNIEHSITIAILWLACLGIGGAFLPWINYFQAAIADTALRKLQIQLIESVSSVPDMTEFEDKSFHDDMTFAQQVLETAPIYFISQISLALQGFIGVVALGFIMADTSWIVALIIFFTVLPHVLVMRGLIKYRYGFARQTHEEWREARYCASSISVQAYAKESRAFGCQEFFSEKSAHYFSRLKNLLLKARFKGIVYPIPSLLLLQIGSLISFFILIAEFRAGKIGSAEIVVVLQGLYAIQGQLEATVGTYHVLARHLMSFRSIFKVIDIRPKIFICRHPLSINASDAIEVRFQNVCFSYPGGKKVLDNLSFTWRWGENLALVGENGCGKSTIVKLILRFYDPESGSIFVNNRPLADYDIEQWRKIISPVFQSFARYEYSIRENLYFDKADLNLDEVAAIIKVCGLSELLENLPDGIETRLGKKFGSTDLSGGQWQKIAIARALCKPSSIMIFDEPTAALDPNIESQLYQLFEKLSKGKSTLMITHRLGSTKMADLILVLSDGRIVESGSHEELLNLNGIYAKMFMAQAAWYQH